MFAYVRAARRGGPGRRAIGRVSAFAVLFVAGALSFSSCTVTSVLTPRAEVGRSAGQAQARGMQRVVPSGVMTAGFPRMGLGSSSSAMPAGEVECRNYLRRAGVAYRDLAPINDGGACRIDYPVEVSALSGGTRMSPPATLSCQMAANFAAWHRNELQPAARWRYWSGVAVVHQGSSYSCRRIAGTSTPSEHARGNALDIMRLELWNGRDIDVRRPGWFDFRERSLLNNVRAGGCQYFTTVLGPGYDAAHADHFHFDIKPRSNGYVACR